MDNDQQFQRIQLINIMTGDLINFAVKKYGQEFSDYVDMNCGAIPEGDYNSIIDPSSPEQFLELYTGIASKRLSLCCLKILELGDGYDKILSDYFYNEGKELGMPEPVTLEDAHYLIRTCVLDGLESKTQYEIVEQSEEHIAWKTTSKKEPAYWPFMAAFVNGLMQQSGIEFYYVEKDEVFVLEKV